MKFKLSTIFVLSLVASFSCFATRFRRDEDVFYNSKGIQRITKIIFAQHEKHDSKKVFYFTQGLEHFCKEKGIEKGDEIAKICILYHGNTAQTEELRLRLPGFLYRTTFERFDDMFHLDSIVDKTPEMEKFVQEMIEKGKSVNQIQTPD